MDVREKLEVIAHLGDHISYKEDIGICYDSDLAKVIEDAYMELKNGVTVQEWIPSKERKPTKEDADKYGRVLVMEIGMIAIVNYLGPINYPDRFPHWMPLPQPTKGE